MIDAHNKGESSYTSDNLKINISQFFDSYKFSFWHGKISPSYNAWKKKNRSFNTLLYASE